MRRRFEAVLFDFFGTLVDNLSASAHNAAIRAMGRTVEAPEQPFLEQWLSDYYARGSGRWDTLEDCIVHTCEAIGVKPDIEHVPEAARIRRAFIREALVLRPDARHTLRALKDRGLKTGVVTDCPPELPSLWPELDLAELIDVPVFSSVAKVRKPDPRIYRLACERLAVKPQTSLFVGDGGSRELSGAQAVGMTALCIRSASEDGYDPHRIDADTWHGPTIANLRELLAIVDAGMP
ncbi:MAG: HAD-IA family hydrolase [Candidatus Hydrogenedentes bacterium]|nr:HAD-IA family hydrolase [Candidatus Hydrogenedentota bacterium]